MSGWGCNEERECPLVAGLRVVTASGRTPKDFLDSCMQECPENMNQEVEFYLFLVFLAIVYENSEITSQRLGKYIALCLFFTYQPPSSGLLLEVWRPHRTALPWAASPGFSRVSRAVRCSLWEDDGGEVRERKGWGAAWIKTATFWLLSQRVRFQDLKETGLRRWKSWEYWPISPRSLFRILHAPWEYS